MARQAAVAASAHTHVVPWRRAHALTARTRILTSRVPPLLPNPPILISHVYAPHSLPLSSPLTAELTKGLQNAAREEKAIAKRDDIVEEVVRRNHMVVEHARETAVHVKQMSARSAAAAEAREQTTREMAEAGGTSLPADGSGVESIVRLPPPQVGDASSLDSPHPVISGASSRGAPGGVPALDTPSEGKKSPTPRPADLAKRAASPRKLSINPAPPPLGLASVGLSGANCFSDLSMKPKHAKDRSKNVVKDVMPKQMPHQTLTPRATEV